MAIPQLTLDTNLIVEYWKRQPKRDVIERLLGFSNARLVDLAVTNRIRVDISRSPLAKRIDALPTLGVDETGTVLRVGLSRVGGADVVGSDRFIQVSDTISLVMKQRGEKPPDWRDWDHLHGHYLKHRDVFLTWDGAILRCARELQSELNLTVMSPEDYLIILESRVKP